jgi:hypothetical protein
MRARSCAAAGESAMHVASIGAATYAGAASKERDARSSFASWLAPRFARFFRRSAAARFWYGVSARRVERPTSSIAGRKRTGLELHIDPAFESYGLCPFAYTLGPLLLRMLLAAAVAATERRSRRSTAALGGVPRFKFSALGRPMGGERPRDDGDADARCPANVESAMSTGV